MAPQPKTRPDGEPLAAFLSRVEPAARRAEAAELAEMFAAVSGYAPRIWGGSMVGFGRYVYRYASGHAGEWFATGFAPRKAEIAIHILPGYSDFGPILADLGPHRPGKSCLYLRRLADVDRAALARLIRAGLDDLATHWPIYPD